MPPRPDGEESERVPGQAPVVAVVLVARRSRTHCACPLARVIGLLAGLEGKSPEQCFVLFGVVLEVTGGADVSALDHCCLAHDSGS